MALITIRDVSIGFRGPPLLDEVSCQIEPGQRIGLMGRNGAGKTTFMRILCGEIEPDHGGVSFVAGTKISLLSQEVPRHTQGRVFDAVSDGLFPTAIEGTGLDDETAWQSQQQVERILSRMSLDGESRFEVLSSGMKRRVLLARALVSAPDLLLLDEPTNHLDIDAIEWLESFLLRSRTTLIFVTHDRMFLRKLATRILEIDRGHLFDWCCDYDTFIKRKEATLAAQDKQDDLFDKKLATEEVWIRQGIKARRTRNEGRVRALEQMRHERRERRVGQGEVRMRIEQGTRSGNLVVDAKDVTFSYNDQPIVCHFSTMVTRGDKIGVMGPNGIGKTTLLRILLGQLSPLTGTVRLGTNLTIAYFDQLREQLDEEATVQENVGQGYESIQVAGTSRHVIGYLSDFLFSPERARTPVRFLSGGERNRVLLARLFARPANVIVLDEPTNDLDAETLEMLEQRLVAYEGTVLLVSHDRAFLNNVVTSTIVFEPTGVKEYVGGYDDWLRQRAEQQDANAAKKSKSSSGSRTKLERQLPSDDEKPPQRRLSFKERQELAELPASIERFEADIAELHHIMAQPEFYQQHGEHIAREQRRLSDLESQLATTFRRWEELEKCSG